MNLILYINRIDAGGQLGGCSVLAGRRYSQGEVKGLLAQAGWPSNLIETMSAIVMAESGGYAGAHNTCGENSVGLGQVYISVHPDAGGQARMSEPIPNLQYCYKLYQERVRQGRSGFGPWGAYTDGRYRKYLGGGGTAVPVAGLDPSSGTYDPATNTYTTGNLATATVSASDDTAAKAGAGVLAALGIVAAIYFLT